MRRIAVACLGAALIGSASWVSGEELAPVGPVEHPPWFKQSFLDLGEDVEEAAARGRHLMLYFYQRGCPYCKLFIEDNLGQRDIADYARENFDFVAINIFGALEVLDLDGEALPEGQYAMKSEVMFTPTLLVYDGSGERVFRMNGYYTPARFRAVMRFLSERRYANERFVEYYAAQDAPEASGVLHAGDSTLEGPPFDLTQRDRDKPLLVLFEQKTCLDCDELHQDIFRRARTQDLLAGFEVVVLDIRESAPLTTPAGEKTSVSGWTARLGIQTVPTQVLFDAEGVEVFRNEGYVKAFHVQSILDYVASGAYRESGDFQRYLQARAERLREQGVRIELMD